MTKLGIASIILNIDVYKDYPPFLEKLGKIMDVHVFYFQGKPPRNSRLIYHHVPYKGSITLYNVWKILNNLTPIVKRENVDAIYVLDGIFYEVLGYLLSKKLRIPLILRLRTNEVKVRSLTSKNKLKFYLWKNLHDFIIKHSNAISCISHELLNYVKFITKNKICSKIIYHGVDIDVFKPYWKKLEEKAVLSVNALTGIKGAYILIGVAKNTYSIKYLVVGRAEQKYLKMLPSNLRYMGYIKRAQMPHIYNKAYLLFMPSLTEGLPDTVLEALASGLPIISSNVGELPYIIKPEIGWIIPKYSINAFVKCLKNALLDVDLLIKMGKRAREYVEKNFKWENYVKKTYELIMSTMSK